MTMLTKTKTLSSSLLYQRVTPFGLIFFLLLIIYWNSFHAGWQLDDRANIIDNPGLRIENLMPENLWGTFFANQGKAPSLYRPLPCLTFALNWYAGRGDPFGYHVVNLGCHIATACFLYLLMLQLLMVYYRDSHHERNKTIENVALLATILWAVNPIQTQAVTYIVQRMAIMAALFYVLGMLYYVKARTAQTSGTRWMYGGVCFLCLACGIGSKENAVLLPASLALIEWIFFRNGSFSFFAGPKVLVSVTATVIGALLTLYITLGRPTQYIITRYADRPFTMIERLMTQPRIVLGYLSQIFFPLPERLSIVHDVTLSTSLFNPWTTVPAIALVLVLIVGAISLTRRMPLLSFAVLFFFLNHVVESTLLPLELVFEHRNYLPSLFLFLPIAAGFHIILVRLPRNSLRRTGTVGIMIAIIFGLVFFTHTRNKDWATWESLWRDAAIKAPLSSRPLVNLGVQLAWRDNPTPANYRHAQVLFQHSLTLSQNRVKEQAEILGNIASVYSFQGNYEKAIEIYLQALTIDPEFHKNRTDLITPLIMSARFEEAALQSQYLIEAKPDNPDYLNTQGFILLLQGKNEAATACFQSALKKGLTSASLLMNLGVALTRTSYFERGQWFLRQAIQQAPRDTTPVFAMIENRIRAGDSVSANKYAQKLVGLMPAPTIIKKLNSLPGDYRFVPVSVELIRPVLARAMTIVLKRFN